VRQPLQIDGADVTLNVMDTFTLDAKTEHVATDISMTTVQPLATPVTLGVDVLAECSFATSTPVEALTVALNYTSRLDREVRGSVSLDGSAWTHAIAFLYTREPGIIATTTVHISGGFGASEHCFTVRAVDSAGKSEITITEAIFPKV
jgi:hypothetical protein